MNGQMPHIVRIIGNQAVKRRISAGANTATRVGKMFQQHVLFGQSLCIQEYHATSEGE
jgi:hypothetical protein